jgi:Zn-dependent membrane protease YugP
MDDLIIFLLMIIIPIGAQMYIMYTYNKYKKVNNSNNLSGFEVARSILDANGLENVHVVEVHGQLSDHYDPKRKVVRLSTEVFHGETIASSSIAAHEVGHAIQDKESYTFLKVRSFIFPFAKIVSYAAYIMLIAAIVMEAINLIWLAIGLMIFSLSFQLVTLPVEFNASQRAKEELNKLNLISNSEMIGVEGVLKSAALTYVASLAASILQILRIVLRFRD